MIQVTALAQIFKRMLSNSDGTKRRQILALWGKFDKYKLA